MEWQYRPISGMDEELKSAKTSPFIKSCYSTSKRNIELFHRTPKPVARKIHISKELSAGANQKTVESVGLYIPEVLLPLFSKVLMLGIPALIAGCKEAILCTPYDKTGKINEAVLYAASVCKISKIYKSEASGNRCNGIRNRYNTFCS